MKALFRILAAGFLACCLFLFFTLTYAIAKKVWFHGRGGPAHVAVLDVDGVLLSANDFLHELRDRLKDPSVKAIVVRVNSPGGMVAPSQEMYDALRRTDKKLPVIISMQSVAASGGYYVSLGGRKIFAEPGTLTGSIGVIMEFVNTQHLYQWAKVERFNLKAGKFKDAGSPLRPMTADERQLFERMLTNVAGQFRGTVKARRKLSDAELDAVADGRVLTGQQALEARLVDQAGGFEEAVREAKRLAKLPEDSEIEYPEPKGGLLHRLLGGEEESRYEGPLQRLLGVLAPPLSPGWRVMLLSPLR